LSRDEIFEAHIRLKAITQFQTILEEMVKDAVDLVDPRSIEDMIRSLHTTPEL
jgi:predicted nucleotidyltransferase